ncbi:unnamed protein product [Heligmosomoides polygyrus]|uniref:ANTAR domain-containing protein n=1 Tax=Heligmosomoides polygyrus TaxID=6339 RepID=A0A183FN81_HELPZ|nr:unnamed protein product [Heligmosomoides polygyrus]
MGAGLKAQAARGRELAEICSKEVDSSDWGFCMLLERAKVLTSQVAFRTLQSLATAPGELDHIASDAMGINAATVVEAAVRTSCRGAAASKGPPGLRKRNRK